MKNIDLTTPASGENDPDLMVTVRASDLLWVILEYGLLVALTEAKMGPPPSMDAAERLINACPDGGVVLPPEAHASLMLTDALVEEAL